MEMAISGVDGIDTIRSQSKQGQAYIFLAFKLGTDLNAAANDVRASIDRIRHSLPKEVEVSITKADDEAENSSILQLAFFDSHRSIRELSDYARQFIASRFENVDGVASVIIYGDQSSVVRVSLDPQKMAALSVVADDVSQTLAEQNIDLPSGQIKGQDRYYPVMTHSALENIEDFNNLIVRQHQSQMVRLKDIGYAAIEPRNEDSFYRVNGQPAVGIAIVPKSTANPLKVSEDAMKIYSDIIKTLPAGVETKVIYNQARYIRGSISHVYRAIFEAILCVLAVILVFFASWRAAFIPIITIPVCLISAFAILYFFKFSINTISLMALALAIGLVVDDAIVMLENIMRHIEMKKSVRQAAQEGGREIIFSIIA
ncbi:MAG TPA: efflux RND transporter permease subunit, partial [Gammaproteobacteria bacterium]|nr:efflux RND transporter permease subunit [Gammaproteobacteria bacterium]